MGKGRKERLVVRSQDKGRDGVTLAEDHAENDHSCLGFLISFFNYSQGTLY